MGVSLDYLSDNVEADIGEEEVKRVQSIQGLPDSEKDLITRTIDALVRDARFRHAYSL
ncbi:hypothetical protein GGR27_001215 [Lewinella antarctica]|uniref:Uncharacterized protein n=1 Tax=Neolewinella antarctica TaxID=442734 RepID=A0ABX0X9N3_9BACT|nr:hypothetical protein [Neolewinella antarctica]